MKKGSGKFVTLHSTNSLKYAMSSYKKYLKWYTDSYQRESTEFSFQVTDNVTGNYMQYDSLPIKKMD